MGKIRLFSWELPALVYFLHKGLWEFQRCISSKLLDKSRSNLMCSITGQRENLLKVFGQIRLHQLRKISVKLLVSLNVCVRVIYFPPTAKVIRRRSQFIVSPERLDYKSSSLTTRPRRLLSFNVSCSQVSGSGSLSLLFHIFRGNAEAFHIPKTGVIV